MRLIKKKKKHHHLAFRGLGVKTQSKVVTQLTLLVAITVLHSVAAEPLHR